MENEMLKLVIHYADAISDLNNMFETKDEMFNSAMDDNEKIGGVLYKAEKELKRSNTLLESEKEKAQRHYNRAVKAEADIKECERIYIVLERSYNKLIKINNALRKEKHKAKRTVSALKGVITKLKRAKK